ncbi:MAG TPA: transglutaminase domain-containing protein, partial [Planctomycetota bacterium]|nr:transglutaminase domain-containing protein [Planctomycetota bacterium]
GPTPFHVGRGRDDVSAESERAMSPTFFAVVALAVPQVDDVDTDGDGLSDFQEIHKYFTDPKSADSDGDGVPDGDWNERREYAYTVRTVVQVLRPVTPDVFCDDYQDARILDETDEYVELEVIHYPLNTVASAISADPDWRRHVDAMREWTRPGLTANWDEPMRESLVAALAEDGIRARQIDDRALVERVSKWLCDHARSVDGFTTFCSTFVDGKVRVFPGLEAAAAKGRADAKLTLEEQWERELFAKGMFERGVRGSCTSSAIYLNGCLRALGIPTRIVLAIPAIDASDPSERELVGRIRHHAVRDAVEASLPSDRDVWSSHTFDEVFVGGRWRRLNYDRLGQNTLDPDYLGLMTHVATFSDWADGNMAATWGTRQASFPRADAFGHANPYSTVALSDRFGAHARIENPPSQRFRALTIEAACWWNERPKGVEMSLDESDGAGHVVVRVAESKAGERSKQYRAFYDHVGKDFVLRAKGQADVPIRADRGYWADPDEGLRHFYLRVEPRDLGAMAVGVPYELAWKGAADSEWRWIVKPGVALARAAPRETTASAAGDPTMRRATELTIDRVCWSDAPDGPGNPIPNARPVILAHVGSGDFFPELKAFTKHADLRFFLEAEGHATLKVAAGIGGYADAAGSYAMIQLGPGDWRDLEDGVDYTLRPQNASASHRWKLAQAFRVRR